MYATPEPTVRAREVVVGEVAHRRRPLRARWRETCFAPLCVDLPFIRTQYERRGKI